MTPKQNDQEVSVRQGSIGPGERLQAARIKLGLSLEDVANRMHLSHGILASIEENNFDEITAPIFVKGYLRAYARIVSLDEDEMIQQYVEYYSDEDPPINSTSNTIPELTVNDARIKWMTYLVILVLVVLLSVWWWNKGQNKNDIVSLGAQDQASQDASQTTSEEALDRTEPVDVVDSVEVVETTETSEDAEVIEAPLATEPVAETNDAADTEVVVEVANTGLEAESAEVLEPVVESQPVINQESATTEITSLPAANKPDSIRRAAPTGSDNLEIIVHADTWADIKDSSGYRLVYDLLRADQVFELSGQAPFAVFFGNGHGVEVIFNDGQVDVASSIRDDNTARLRIGS